MPCRAIGTSTVRASVYWRRWPSQKRRRGSSRCGPEPPSAWRSTQSLVASAASSGPSLAPQRSKHAEPIAPVDIGVDKRLRRRLGIGSEQPALEHRPDAVPPSAYRYRRRAAVATCAARGTAAQRRAAADRECGGQSSSGSSRRLDRADDDEKSEDRQQAMRADEDQRRSRTTRCRRRYSRPRSASRSRRCCRTC